MIVLVCGGRNYRDQETVFRVLNEIHGEEGQIEAVIHGGATGADHRAHSWAFAHGVCTMQFDPNFRAHGKAAGPIRNADMLMYGRPDLVVAFPGGKGTANMVQQAKKAAVPVREVPR